MKSFTLPLLLILFFTSCITSTHVHYSDPNYLNSDQFSTYEEMTANNKENEESYNTDTTLESTNDYTVDDYYDYSFSSRIRRFHRPMYNTGYYGGIYTDYYWYNNNPFYCGTSIYYGYNWNSPYYSYYSYSPYYADYYYTPYYYGSYYSYNGYGYNNHHASHQTYYNNNNNHNSYISGHRGSLSSIGKDRGVSVSTNSNILSNTTHKNSTLNIRNNNTLKNNTPNSRNYKPKTNSNIKTDKRSNTKNSSSTTIKTNSNRKNNSYSTTKKNTTKYNSNRGNNRSNSNKKSSARGGIRSAKPRR